MTIEEQMNELIRKSIQNEIWDYAKFRTIITQSGSSKPNLWIHKDGQEERFIPDEIFEINKLSKTNFNTFKDDINKRFNTVEFEVYRDGSYKAHYYWDEGEDKDQKLKTAEVFPIWLHERFLQFLFEAGYGDIENWQKGTFKVKIDKEENVQTKATLYNKDQEFDAQVLIFPQAVYDAILSHYEITNNGILSDTWQKWNTLIIQTRRTSVDLERDVEYRLEE